MINKKNKKKTKVKILINNKKLKKLIEIFVILSINVKFLVVLFIFYLNYTLEM